MASIDPSGAGRSLARILLVAAGLAAAAPASAQWLGFFDDGPIPPGGIVRSLMSRGFVEIGRPRLRGDVYVVEGVNARGTRLRLVIDAYDGSLVSRTRLDAPLLPPAEVGRGGRVLRPDPFRDGFGRPLEDDAIAPPREARPIDPAPRKPAKAAPRAVPSAPAAPVEAAKPEPAKTETAKAEPPKAEPAPATAAVAPAPAKPAQPPAPAAAKPAEPPAQELPQRSVRVIEGVTPVVPQPAEEKKPEITPPATLE